MPSYRTTVSSGQPFNIPTNNVLNSVSGSWTLMGDSVKGRAVRVQGIYWSSTTPGAYLQIRDVIQQPNDITRTGVVWYDAQCLGGAAAIDLFQAHLTLFTPFEYFDSEGSNTIIIYGEYV